MAKQGGGRTKGHSFERKVAKLVLKAAVRIGVSKKDCFRTPLSGGHPHAAKGDLVVSPLLQRIFPFCVECKHTKKWDVKHILQPGNETMNQWTAQAKRNASSSGEPPLLVISGNYTGLFVGGLANDLVDYMHGIPVPHFAFYDSAGLVWYLLPAEIFWRRIRWKAKREQRRQQKSESE